MEQTKDPGYVPGWGGTGQIHRRHSGKKNVQDTGVETGAGRRQGLHEFSRMVTRRSSLGRTRSSQGDTHPGRSRGSGEPGSALQSQPECQESGSHGEVEVYATPGRTFSILHLGSALSPLVG